MRLRLGVLESLSDTTNLRRSVSSLEKQDVFDGYTKVVISVSDDVEYSAGTDTGRTMTLVCPWGTQAMAETLLSRVRGFQYQPFTAYGAHLDPSVELGDGVTVVLIQDLLVLPEYQRKGIGSRERQQRRCEQQTGEEVFHISLMMKVCFEIPHGRSELPERRCEKVSERHGEGQTGGLGETIVRGHQHHVASAVFPPAEQPFLQRQQPIGGLC